MAAFTAPASRYARYPGTRRKVCVLLFQGARVCVCACVCCVCLCVLCESTNGTKYNQPVAGWEIIDFPGHSPFGWNGPGNFARFRASPIGGGVLRGPALIAAGVARRAGGAASPRPASAASAGSVDFVLCGSARSAGGAAGPRPERLGRHRGAWPPFGGTKLAGLKIRKTQLCGRRPGGLNAPARTTGEPVGAHSFPGGETGFAF